jgi:2-phosphosulfolactate phosphatase
LIDVAFTPGERRGADVAVVVDVLRATSTVAAALGSGYRGVLCCGRIEDAERLRSPRRVLAGERDSRPVPGFDNGNSPSALPAGAGRELVLCTTNGSPAILSAAEGAREVLIGCLLNLRSLTEAIPPAADVTVVCAGTGGGFSLEDAYAAGRIVAGLIGERTDAARAAERIASAYADPVDALAESAHAATLRETGQAEDIAFCAQVSVFQTVPQVTAVSSGVASVSERLDVGGPSVDHQGRPHAPVRSAEAASKGGDQ